MFNAKLKFELTDSTKLTILVTDYDQPLAQDPGALTKAEFGSNPKQTTIKAITFNTQVAKSQTQAGFKLDHIFDENNQANAMLYLGERENLQYQSAGANSATTRGYTPGYTPISGTDTNNIRSLASGTGVVIKGSSGYYYGDPKDTTLFGGSAGTVANGNGGGVAEIKRNFWGTDLRVTHKGNLGNGPYQITLGTNFDTMTDARKGYDNFILGTATIPHSNVGYTYQCGTEIICGVKGILRRDEDNTAWNFDQYAQGEWSPTGRLKLTAGVRHNNVHLKSQDYFKSNGDGSGSVGFSKTTPVVGAIFKVNDNVNIYANAGEGFETPSLVEMAYLPGGTGGFNTSLKPATSDNYEIGVKAFVTENTRATLAIFKTKTNNEIVVADSTNGRSSYQNAGSTERNGIELTLDSYLGHGFGAFASYAYLDAKYTSAFCSGSVKATKAACESPNTTVVLPPASSFPTYGTWVTSEKAIPGAYRQTAYAEVSWKHPQSGFSSAIEARAIGKVTVDDKSNEEASGYAILNWRGGFTQQLNKWRFSEFLRVENILDKDYVGSVKVNESAKQYYEPGAGVNWLMGINANYQF